MASAAAAWRAWNFEQRTAAVAAVLLIVSTFGPFSFVEVALILVAGGVLWLLKSRAEGKRFHLPFGDGSVILAAGVWCGAVDRGAPVRPPARPEPPGAGLRRNPGRGGPARAGQAPARRPARERPGPEEPDFDLPERSVPTERAAPSAAAGASTAARLTGPATPAARRGQAPLPGLPDRPADVPEPETPPEFEPTKKLDDIKRRARNRPARTPERERPE